LRRPDQAERTLQKRRVPEGNVIDLATRTRLQKRDEMMRQLTTVGK